MIIVCLKYIALYFFSYLRVVRPRYNLSFTPPHYTNLQKYVKLSVVKENVDVCNRRTRDRKLYYDG